MDTLTIRNPETRRVGLLKKKPIMTAAVIAAPGRGELVQKDLPELGENEVRVRLEGCGMVDKIGPGVSQVSVGDRVSLLSYRAYAEYDVAPESSVIGLPSQLNG